MKKSSRLNHLEALVASAALIAAACGAGPGEVAEPAPGGAAPSVEQPSGPTSLDGAWVLVAGTVDGALLTLSDRARVAMTIDGSDIGGRAACNSYGGVVSIVDGQFSMSEIARTEMGCERDVMELESLFLTGLTTVANATRSGVTASLTGDGVEYTFELLAPVPTAELTGSNWVLDTVFLGDAVSSTSASADPATLVLNADGTFTAGTGCRDLMGEYVIAGDTVQFTSLAATGDCPADLALQDGSVIAVLESGFTVQVDGNRLTITAQDGQALSYQVQP